MGQTNEPKTPRHQNRKGTSLELSANQCKHGTILEPVAHPSWLEPPLNLLQINVSTERTEPSRNLLRIQVGWKLPGNSCKSMSARSLEPAAHPSWLEPPWKNLLQPMSERNLPRTFCTSKTAGTSQEHSAANYSIVFDSCQEDSNANQLPPRGSTQCSSTPESRNSRASSFYNTCEQRTLSLAVTTPSRSAPDPSGRAQRCLSS